LVALLAEAKFAGKCRFVYDTTFAKKEARAEACWTPSIPRSATRHVIAIRFRSLFRTEYGGFNKGNQAMPTAKRKTIAGLDYDQWLEKTGQEAAPPVKKKYSRSLIAFLDVLGIKKLISDHTGGREHLAIDKIEEMRKIVETSVEVLEDRDDFYLLHISDSFVFLCRPADIVVLIELLSTVQMRIIQECRFLLRGAVTIGDAIIREDGKFIIGPAYIRAFQLQENDAVYPRIIVDTSVVQAIKKAGKEVAHYLREDADKEYFVDYITVYMAREKLKPADMRIRLKRESTFDFLKKRYEEHYNKEDHHIAQKFGWTIEYCKGLQVWEEE
jgi:hypothetical protein